MKKISVIVPVFNEAESLPFLYDRLTSVFNKIENYSFEILFVNDGSTDESLSIIKNLRKSVQAYEISYVNLSRNYGKETAMAAGLDYANGDAIIIIDADLQDPPELIPEMIKHWEDGYDDVYAKRRSRKGETWFKKKTSYCFYRLLKKLSKVNIQADTGDFRLLSKRAVESLRKYKEQHRYTKGLFSLIGYRKKEVLFDRDPRIAGKTKWNYFKLLNLAIEGITSFTSAPLRISTFTGIIVALTSFVYIFIIIAKTLIFGEKVQGYPSLICVILFLSGVQLICLGITGEYIGRIFNETKNRPLYFIDEYNEEK